MPGARPSGKIFVGPAGWSYPDWDGIVYPHSRPRGFHEAGYLARFFDVIEINTTFYHPPRAETVAAWVRVVESNKQFRFTAKLWQRFTHERSASLQDEKTFKQAIEPLRQAGRLGALLVQFPWSFRNTKENHEYLSGLLLQFMEFPLVVEVRHASWNHEEIYRWLQESGVGFCNIDQPVIGRSMAPSDRATSAVGYVRLHGRNYEHWFTSGERPEERYDYLYSLAELGPWVERIRNIAQHADVTYVITNNHFQGKGVTNALQLIALLRGQAVEVPEHLLASYPELRPLAVAEPRQAPRQADLAFGE
ncbi:MAG TPA: DUF72 domain-containing protein [Terriglobia bacterium]|nr:DUF72 domain-containing protein [Terriglobia bacterium]